MSALAKYSRARQKQIDCILEDMATHQHTTGVWVHLEVVKKGLICGSYELEPAQ